METVEFKSITLTGIILPTEWDRRGNVMQVSLFTENFEKIILADNGAPLDLFDYIDKIVEIHGTWIGEDIFGHKMLRVELLKPVLQQR